MNDNGAPLGNCCNGSVPTEALEKLVKIASTSPQGVTVLSSPVFAATASSDAQPLGNCCNGNTPGTVS